MNSKFWKLLDNRLHSLAIIRYLSFFEKNRWIYWFDIRWRWQNFWLRYKVNSTCFWFL